MPSSGLVEKGGVSVCYIKQLKNQYYLIKIQNNTIIVRDIYFIIKERIIELLELFDGNMYNIRLLNRNNKLLFKSAREPDLKDILKMI